jgi:hypothetical protein
VGSWCGEIGFMIICTTVAGALLFIIYVFISSYSLDTLSFFEFESASKSIMTAEVAVLNEKAVALATDSAVTSGSGKIYTSANKLFTLSKVHPVGIMIYNDANFMGIPLETVIKVFREELGDKSYDTLSEYADAFTSFLTDKNNYLFSKVNLERGIRHYLGRVAYKKFDDIFKEYNKDRYNRAIRAITEGRRPASSGNILRWILDSRIKSLEDKDDVSDITFDDASRIGSNYDDYLDEVLEEVFKNESITSKNRLKLHKLVFLSLVKEWHIWSGVVIAGFGEKDAFPRLTSFILGTLLDDMDPNSPHNKLKVKTDRENLDARPEIIPFAQTREIYSFVRGIENNYRDFLLSYWHRALSNFVDTVTQIIPSSNSSLDTKLRDLVTRLVSDLEGGMSEFERDIANPILQNLRSLPKDELGKFAESLVSIVSLKKRVSTEDESVGGPIDVAVISKGDGFIWLQRKHYFSLEKNMHFERNYFRSIDA